MTPRLDTMEPPADWDPKPHEAAIAKLRQHRTDLVFRVWGGDWCGDCQAVLPEFAGALAAADVPADAIKEYPVESDATGAKQGPLVDEYDIELIPTIVVERDGQELVRFVENADRHPAAVIADALADQAHPRNQT